jgi:hypothetical protein
MILTVLKAALAGALVVASIAAPLAVRHWQQVQSRQRMDALRQQAARLADLAAENQRLSDLVAQAGSPALTKQQFRELLQLRGEIGRLREAAKELDRLQAADRQLPAGQPTAEGSARPAPPPDPQQVQAYWPKSQLAHAGFNDPTAALQTALWAMSRGDPEALAASVTPEAKTNLTRELWFEHGPQAEELAASTRLIAESFSPTTGFYVVGQRLESPDEAELEVYFEGEGKTRPFTLKRIGREWKFDSLGNGNWP